jgi:hypothetical protein
MVFHRGMVYMTRDFAEIFRFGKNMLEIMAEGTQTHPD